METNPTSVMTPQEIAADIARELREHPEHWIQGSLVGFANGERGNDAESVNADNATCWCFEGLIYKRTGTEDNFAVLEAFRAVIGMMEIHIWNDELQTTVALVIDVCDRVASSSSQQEVQNEHI